MQDRIEATKVSRKQGKVVCFQGKKKQIKTVKNCDIARSLAGKHVMVG